MLNVALKCLRDSLHILAASLMETVPVIAKQVWSVLLVDDLAVGDSALKNAGNTPM